jgi:hypothetical protein
MPRPGDLPQPTEPSLPDPDPDDLPINDPPVPGVPKPDTPIKDPPRPPEVPTVRADTAENQDPVEGQHR